MKKTSYLKGELYVRLEPCVETKKPNYGTGFFYNFLKSFEVVERKYRDTGPFFHKKPANLFILESKPTTAMKPRLPLLLATALLLTTFVNASDPSAPELKAHRFSSPPVIDGVMDPAWEALPWYSLNYVWMDWGETVDSSDYYGRFKLAWSEDTDLLYFYVEITDDVLIERFAEKRSTNHYNDIVEVFLDEDNSGGLHVFDGTGSLGTNAENAFSYHLTPLGTPTEEEPVTEFTVSDLDGTNWGDSFSPEYFPHFPDAILKKSGDRYFWEFSLIVYNDQYEAGLEESTRVELNTGKEMGIALAYCETDNPDVYLREMFFGSFEGDPDELGNADGGANFGYNETWKDATDYSLLTLEEEVPGTGSPSYGTNPADQLFIYTHVHQRNLEIRLQNTLSGKVNIQIIDLTGRVLQSTDDMKVTGRYQKRLSIPSYKGIYLVKVSVGQYVGVRKVFVE